LFKHVVELFTASSEGDEQISYYCHKVIIVARAPKFFEILTDTSTVIEADDEKKSNSNTIPLDGSNLQTILLNDKVSSRVLEVFLVYSYFEEAELDVFNNEQLLEVINLCAKISAQGLVNVAITELGKRLRRGQKMYLKYLEHLCLTNNFPNKQVSAVQTKQAEMEGESTETQTKMEADRAAGDNVMLCDEQLNTTDFLNTEIPAESGVPFPQGLSTDFTTSGVASDTSELSKEMITTSTASYDDELPEDGLWWSPLHLIAMTKEWNIPYLEDVLINAHILLNYEENAEYVQDEASIQNIPTTTLRKMVKLHTGCFRDKKISAIDPEVQAVSLGRSLNDDLYRLFDEQDPRWSDCSVVVGDTVFLCHKVILGSRSRYFKSFCKINTPLVISNFTSAAIRSLLVWIYSDKVHLTKDTSMELLGVTSYFQLPSSHVEQKCVTTLLNSCSPSSLPSIMNAAICAKATQMCLFLGEIVREYDSDLLKELMKKISRELLITLGSIVTRHNSDRPGFYDIKVPRLDDISTSKNIVVGQKLCFKAQCGNWLTSEKQLGDSVQWTTGEVLAIDGEYIYFQYGAKSDRRWVRGEANGELSPRFKFIDPKGT